MWGVCRPQSHLKPPEGAERSWSKTHRKWELPSSGTACDYSRLCGSTERYLTCRNWRPPKAALLEAGAVETENR